MSDNTFLNKEFIKKVIINMNIKKFNPRQIQEYLITPLSFLNYKTSLKVL